MQKFKVKGQSVPKPEWKETDRHTEATALPPMLMRSVKILEYKRMYAENISQNALMTERPPVIGYMYIRVPNTIHI